MDGVEKWTGSSCDMHVSAESHDVALHLNTLNKYFVADFSLDLYHWYKKKKTFLLHLKYYHQLSKKQTDYWTKWVYLALKI